MRPGTSPIRAPNAQVRRTTSRGVLCAALLCAHVVTHGCKRDATQGGEVATSASATAGETLPNVVVEIEGSAVKVFGKQVDSIRTLDDEQRVMPLPGLTAALTKASAPEGCVVRIERTSALWVTLSMLNAMSASPCGASSYLDTRAGAVRINQSEPEAKHSW